MTLDKNRKYEFLGNVYEWDQEGWDSVDYTWASDEFQFFANKGLVKEVREPIVGRGRVRWDKDGDWISDYYLYKELGLTRDQVSGRTFDIVATEVVE